MHWFDPLTSKWQLRCPESPVRIGVGLASFRRVERLEGSSRPSAYRVDYHCPLCCDQHHVMLTGDQLDLEPLGSMPSSFLDLKTGKMDWPVEMVIQLWANSIQKGHWPLHLPCRHQNKWFGGWPSLLQRLEPDHPHNPRQIMVYYHCPLCERAEFRQMSVLELQLRAIN